MPLVPAFALRFAYCRKRLGFTQRELASQVGISKSSLANFERGHQEIPFSIGLNLCRRMDVSPRFIVEGKLPGVPFVPLSELGFEEEKIISELDRADFRSGYLIFRAKLEEWYQSHSDQEIDLMRFKKDLSMEYVVRQASAAQLQQWIDGYNEAERMGAPVGEFVKIKLAKIELAERASVVVPRRRSVKKHAGENKVLLKDQVLLYRLEDMKGSLLSHWITRANALLSAHGAKAALARRLGWSSQALHGFLSGANAPSAENILRLQAWVMETEAQQKASEGTIAPSEKTQTRRNEKNSPSSPKPE